MSDAAAWRLAALTGLSTVGFAAAPLGGQEVAGSWQLIRPAAVSVVGRMTHRKLAEASGAAASHANPGLFWTIGDSGNPPELLAVDTTGALRAVIPIDRVANVDWEAVTVGPCGEATCVYIGDLGDNSERRGGVMIHRFGEPTLPAGEGIAVLPPLRATTLRVSYPDRPHDVEAMGIAPDGNLLLITKGRRDGILVFQIPATAWEGANPSAVATLAGRLPIEADLGRGTVVTDLAIDREGARVAVKTYRTIYLFERRGDGSLSPDHWTACNVLGTEPQGEGITWLDGWRLLLLSERGMFPAGTVTIAECRPAATQ